MHRQNGIRRVAVLERIRDDEHNNAQRQKIARLKMEQDALAQRMAQARSGLRTRANRQQLLAPNCPQIMPCPGQSSGPSDIVPR